MRLCWAALLECGRVVALEQSHSKPTRPIQICKNNFVVKWWKYPRCYHCKLHLPKLDTFYFEIDTQLHVKIAFEPRHRFWDFKVFSSTHCLFRDCGHVVMWSPPFPLFSMAIYGHSKRFPSDLRWGNKDSEFQNKKKMSNHFLVFVFIGAY